MLSTTFRLLRDHDACAPRYRHLAKALGGLWEYGIDTPITLLQIMEICGVKDATWALRATLPGQEAARDRLARLFACDCAEHVLPLYEAACPGDERARVVIALARRYAAGQATREELDDARENSLGCHRLGYNTAAAAARDTTWLHAADAAYEGADSARLAAWWVHQDDIQERTWQAARLRERLTAEEEK